MPKTEAGKAARDRWDAANMAYQTVKVNKALLESFRACVAANGDRVNTVLRLAMEEYIEKHNNKTEQ